MEAEDLRRSIVPPLDYESDGPVLSFGPVMAQVFNQRRKNSSRNYISS